MINNINDLREQLCELFDRLGVGSMDAKQAKEINNAAGKIIGTVKVQLEYSELRDEKPDIDFLATNDGPSNIEKK